MNGMEEQEIYNKVKAPIATMATGGLLGAQLYMDTDARDRQKTADSNWRKAAEAGNHTHALRSMNLAQVEKVFRDDWLDRADIRDITTTYTLTREMSGEDPRFREAAERIEHLVRERYGVDPAQTGNAMELEHALHASDKTIENTAASPEAQSASSAHHEASDHKPGNLDNERIRLETERLREAGLSEEQATDAIRVQLGNARPVNEAAQAGANGAGTHTANNRHDVSKTMGKTRGLTR